MILGCHAASAISLPPLTVESCSDGLLVLAEPLPVRAICNAAILPYDDGGRCRLERCENCSNGKAKN